MRYLGRATEEVLLYIEGRPGVLRTWVHTYLAAGRDACSADQVIGRAAAAGLIEAHLTPDGIRLWVTTAGLGLLHSVDYAGSNS